MDNKFYGRVTKSGNNLQVHIPKDFKDVFKYGTFVCVYALDTEEIVKEEVIRNLNQQPVKMEIYDAKEIIEGYDPHYDYNGKSSHTIIEHAKHLLEQKE